MVSSSFGVWGRSKELEEVEVEIGLEEGDLFVAVDQEDIFLVMIVDCCSSLVEAASLCDVRRTEEVVGSLFSTL